MFHIYLNPNDPHNYQTIELADGDGRNWLADKRSNGYLVTTDIEPDGFGWRTWYVLESHTGKYGTDLTLHAIVDHQPNQELNGPATGATC